MTAAQSDQNDKKEEDRMTTTMTEEETTTEQPGQARVADEGSDDKGEKKPAKKSGGPRKALAETRALWRRSKAKVEAEEAVKKRRGMPVWLRAVIFYGMVLAAYWIMAVAISTGAIPILAIWLHEQAGLAAMEPNSATAIALWIMPLLFFVLLVLAGTLAVMRSMWRWATRRVNAGRAGRVDRAPEPAGGTAVTKAGDDDEASDQERPETISELLEEEKRRDSEKKARAGTGGSKHKNRKKGRK